MSNKVGQKGQVVISKEIRDKLGEGEIAYNEIDTARHLAALNNDVRFAHDGAVNRVFHFEYWLPKIPLSSITPLSHFLFCLLGSQ